MPPLSDRPSTNIGDVTQVVYESAHCKTKEVVRMYLFQKQGLRGSQALFAVILVIVGVGRISLAAESFPEWLQHLPNGYLSYTYEVAGKCTQSFCAPQYHGKSVTLNCRDHVASGGMSYVLVGRKEALHIEFVGKLRGGTFKAPVAGDGSWSFSHNATNISSISHSGKVVGPWLEGQYSETSYRHDPYLGWYNDRTYECHELKGGPLPNASSIVEDPRDQGGNWWSAIGEKPVELKFGGSLKGVMKYRSSGTEADLGWIGINFVLKGQAPGNLRLAYVGGWDFKSHGRGEANVEPATGKFHLNWLAGPGEMTIDGHISGSQLILETYHATWPFPGWTDTENQTMSSFAIPKS